MAQHGRQRLFTPGTSQPEALPMRPEGRRLAAPIEGNDPMKTRSRAVGVALAAATLLAASGAAVPAHAAAALVECVGFSNRPSTDTITVTTSGTVSEFVFLYGCTAPGNSEITTGGLRGFGTATTNTAGRLVLNMKGTIGWSNGTQSTVTYTRTITGTSNVLEVGAGKVHSGTFNQGIIADTAYGTRAKSGTNTIVNLTLPSFTIT
ncbi:hypothetical protein AB0C52_08410 [Streptomyces sp. NPDC048717]|uniref:hypothetical protein n=1 Tax=Streptomyces sp. NPDC048717 TaxID=3154928 RepID=UPI00341647A1